MEGQLSFFEQTKPTVLLSLREEYLEEMLSGKKKYEYRTRYLKEPTTAFIYISKTKKSIVAKVDFGYPIIGDAKTIALLAEECEPGCYDAMIEYLYNDIGYAIPVESIELLEEIEANEIKKIFPDFVVPQSYYILDKKPELLSYLNSIPQKEECLKKKL